MMSMFDGWLLQEDACDHMTSHTVYGSLVSIACGARLDAARTHAVEDDPGATTGNGGVTGDRKASGLQGGGGWTKPTPTGTYGGRSTGVTATSEPMTR